MSRTLLLLVLCGCTEAMVEDLDETGTDTDALPATPGEPERIFSFAVLADPHVTREGDRANRLRAAMAWIEDARVDRDIELILVAGDVAWHDGLDLTEGILQTAAVPVVPIIGDNEIHVGDEAAYDATFTDHYAALADDLEGWARAPVPVANPDRGGDSWFQNWAFDHKGVRFLGLDWASRDPDPLLSEFAALHDVDGGTWDWFTDQLDALGEGPSERVVMLTHNPMMFLPGGFFLADQERVVAATEPWSDVLSAAYGGHLHLDLVELLEEPAGYDVFITDATWDDDVRVRTVAVWFDGRTFTYEQDLVTVPY